MPRAMILGTGRALPERVVANSELAGMMDTTDQWIRERTGIETRHWVSGGESGVDLAERASRQALATAGVEAESLDAIVYASSTPDHFMPANGTFLQRRLGLGPIPAFNLINACSGFVYALATADAFLRAGSFRRVLVVGQEIQSTRLDRTTRGRATAVIFADGAGAVVVGATEETGRGILAFDLHGDGTHAEKLWVDGPGAMYHPPVSLDQLEAGKYFLQMEGREVFRHAVVRMPESVQTVLAAAGLSTADIGLLIPHQANLRISEAVQKSLALRDDQVFNNIQRYGNTTAGTIPIALDECARSGRLAPGDVVVLTAFGSGFQWGSVVLRW